MQHSIMFTGGASLLIVLMALACVAKEENNLEHQKSLLEDLCKEVDAKEKKAKQAAQEAKAEYHAPTPETTSSVTTSLAKTFGDTTLTTRIEYQLKCFKPPRPEVVECKFIQQSTALGGKTIVADQPCAKIRVSPKTADAYRCCSSIRGAYYARLDENMAKQLAADLVLEAGNAGKNATAPANEAATTTTATTCSYRC